MTLRSTEMKNNSKIVMSIANETICKNFLKQLRSYSDANWTKQQEYICNAIVQTADQRGKQYSNESEVDFKINLKRSLNVFRDKAKVFSNGSQKKNTF